MRLRALAVVVVVAAVSVSLFAQVARRDGKWEVQMQISMPGVAAQMPPTTVTQCVTKEQVSDPTKAFPQAQGRGGASNGCKVADYKVDGNNVTFSMACDAPQSLTMKGEFVYGVDTYNGTIHVAVDRGGQPTSMTMNYSAKRLGDCVK